MNPRCQPSESQFDPADRIRYLQRYYRFLLTFHGDKYVEACVLLYCKLRSRSREYLNSRYPGWISRDWDYRFGTSAVPRWQVCEQTRIYFMANYVYLWYTRLNICNKPTNFVKWLIVSVSIWECSSSLISMTDFLIYVTLRKKSNMKCRFLRRFHTFDSFFLKVYDYLNSTFAKICKL